MLEFYFHPHKMLHTKLNFCWYQPNKQVSYLSWTFHDRECIHLHHHRWLHYQFLIIGVWVLGFSVCWVFHTFSSSVPLTFFFENQLPAVLFFLSLTLIFSFKEIFIWMSLHNLGTAIFEYLPARKGNCIWIIPLHLTSPILTQHAIPYFCHS